MRVVRCKDCNKTVDALYTRGDKCPLCYKKHLNKKECVKCATITTIIDGGLCELCSNKMPHKKSAPIGQARRKIPNLIVVKPRIQAKKTTNGFANTKQPNANKMAASSWTKSKQFSVRGLNDNNNFPLSGLNSMPARPFTDVIPAVVERPEINKSFEVHNHDMTHPPNDVNPTSHNESIDYDFDLTPAQEATTSAFGTVPPSNFEQTRSSESSDAMSSHNEPSREKKNESHARQPEKRPYNHSVAESDFGTVSSDEESADGLHKNIEGICARLEVNIYPYSW